MVSSNQQEETYVMARHYDRMIPEEYLDKQLTFTYWSVTNMDGIFQILNAMQETMLVGFLDFSGERHIVVKYYRRNKVTKRSRAYKQTIYKQDLIGWSE
jgi:hypothetical protein